MSATSQSRMTTTGRSIAFAAICLLGFVVTVAAFHRDAVTASVDAADMALLSTTSSWAIPWEQAPILVALGLGVGALSGFLGMGGGVVLMAAMLILLRTEMSVARTVTMLTMLVASAAAVWHHRRAGLRLDMPGWAMLAAALGGTAIGLVLGFVTSGATLKTVFGFFLFFLGVFMLTSLLGGSDREEEPDEPLAPTSRSRRMKLAGAVGVGHGILCGLLGISGGVVTTPMQQMALATPVRKAIALSLLLSVPCTAIGSLALIAMGAHRGIPSMAQVFTLLAFLGLPAALGAHVGARLSGYVNRSFLAITFALLYVVGSLSIVAR